MTMIVLILIFVPSLAFWYVYYGLECYLNGASIGRNQYAMPFLCLWEETLWILPGGRRRKLAFARGDADWADELPGPVHYVLTHGLILGGPLAVYCLS